MQIMTARLLIRDEMHDDLDAFYEIDSDPEVVRYVSYGPWTREECQRDLAFHIEEQHASPRTSYYLAMILRKEERLIGGCSLVIVSRRHREGELGYGLNRNYWGYGYATEAAQALLAFGFTTLQLHRIFATCHPENKGSERVMQKIGMRKEGHLRENKWGKGAWRDSLLYAIIESDWKPDQSPILSL